jgi:predicted DsbA family dithiol-disulfide isomerase
LLRQMRQLAGSTLAVLDELLKTLWLQQLPANVQAMLASLASTLGLDELQGLYKK